MIERSIEGSYCEENRTSPAHFNLCNIANHLHRPTGMEKEVAFKWLVCNDVLKREENLKAQRMEYPSLANNETLRSLASYQHDELYSLCDGLQSLHGVV